MRKVLRNSSSGSQTLLRDIVFDARGNVKPARMSAVLNAALGYVAEQTDGFVDFDAVPAEGAPLQVRLSHTRQDEAHLPSTFCAALPGMLASRQRAKGISAGRSVLAGEPVQDARKLKWVVTDACHTEDACVAARKKVAQHAGP